MDAYALTWVFVITTIVVVLAHVWEYVRKQRQNRKALLGTIVISIVAVAALLGRIIVQIHSIDLSRSMWWYSLFVAALWSITLISQWTFPNRPFSDQPYSMSGLYFKISIGLCVMLFTLVLISLIFHL